MIQGLVSFQKGINTGTGGRERQRRRFCQTCFSRAGPRRHLLSSFEGVVMVTVASGKAGESVLHRIPVAHDVAPRMMRKQVSCRGILELKQDLDSLNRKQKPTPLQPQPV